MVFRPIFAAMCTASLALGSSVAAQDFQIFDHGIGQASRGSETLTASDPQAPHGQKSVLRAPYPQIGFKEALYEPLIREAEVRHRLPPRLLRALVWQESRFDPLAVSPAGAVGLAQLMPATAKELGVRNRYDPAESLDGGARYLRQMLDRFQAIHLALAAYNAGPGAVSRTGGIPKNRETPSYVRSVIDRWMAYGSL